MVTNYNKFSIIEFTSSNSSKPIYSKGQLEQPKKRGRPPINKPCQTSTTNTMFIKSTEMINRHLFSQFKLLPYESEFKIFNTLSSTMSTSSSIQIKKKPQVLKKRSNSNSSLTNSAKSPLSNSVSSQVNLQCITQSPPPQSRIIRTSISIKELLN